MALSASRTEQSGLREFLNSPRGKGLAFALVAVLLIGSGYGIYKALGPTEAEAAARDRIFIDSKTMKPFTHELQKGDKVPILAPSGGNTGYPAELCYWTKDGKIKKDPTPVLVKIWLGDNSPTFCPDCGRLVVGHNPMAQPGMKPPPTQAEYTAHKSR